MSDMGESGETAGAAEEASIDGPASASSTTTTAPPPAGSPVHGPVPGAGGGPQPLWKPRADPRRLGWRFWAAVALGAVGTDIALRTPPWNNTAGTVGVLAIVGGLLLSGRVRTLTSQVALGIAAILGVFLVLRSNPALVVFNVIAILGLTWVAVAHNRGRSVWETSPMRLLVRGAETVATGVETLPDAGAEIAARRRKLFGSGGATGQVVASVFRGLAIAAPLLLVLGLLLSTADAVFASFFSVSIEGDPGPFLSHVVLVALGALGMLVLLRMTGRNLGAHDVDVQGFRLGLVETMVVLISLDVLFAGFGVAQLLALTGSADAVLEEAGLTVKEYARQGFFQLLWVAGLTAMALITLHVLSRHHERRGRTAIRVASLVAVGLTFVIVGVAFSRLQLYIDYDGHTPLRFYSLVFSVWIAVVFVILAARILGYRPDTSWFTSVVGASAVLFLLGLNLANPEAIIVNANLDRDDRQVLWHIDQFSADGDVVLAEGLDRLPDDVADEVRDEYCISNRRPAERLEERTGLRYNRSEQRFLDVYDEFCP
ncbi:MAG: DUF4173 domain-containing protein [Actinomycetota bacterium]